MPNNQSPLGHLYLIAAPSGGGKTSLVKELRQSLDKTTVSISYTTRPKRPNEIEGKHYHFVDKKTFKTMAKDQLFVEQAYVFGHYYGTCKNHLQQQRHDGTDVLLDIDWQGVHAIKQAYPNESSSIFILPPSKSTLRERLCKRNQDSDQTIDHRMDQAQSEMSHYHEFDYLIINESFELAFIQLKHLILSQRLKTKHQADRHRLLLKELLA